MKATVIGIVVVLTIVAIALLARVRPLQTAVFATGAAIGATVVAACVGMWAVSSAGVHGGGDSTPQLQEFHGERFTPDEIREIKRVTGRKLPMSALPETVDDIKVRLPYRPRVYPSGRRPAHFGQRKLLMSEVDFLTRNAKTGDTVVYAGSAPGTHIPFLAELFAKKKLKYRLYDPRDFDKMPTGAGIRTFQQYFTDETAKEYAGRDDVLFISDIRIGSDNAEHPSLEQVEKDMAMQEGWVDIMQPRAAMLKYRLNWSAEKNDLYLRGSPRLQVWPGAISTETRLEVRRPIVKEPRNSREYEEKLFYYNSILREWAMFDHGLPLRLVDGLDHCADCAGEIRMWRRYLEEINSPPTDEAVAKLMNRVVTFNYGRSLDTFPHGIEPGVASRAAIQRAPPREWKPRKYKTDNQEHPRLDTAPPRDNT